MLDSINVLTDDQIEALIIALVDGRGDARVTEEEAHRFVNWCAGALAMAAAIKLTMEGKLVADWLDSEDEPRFRLADGVTDVHSGDTEDDSEIPPGGEGRVDGDASGDGDPDHPRVGVESGTGGVCQATEDDPR